MISPFLVGETSHDYDYKQQWHPNTRHSRKRHNSNRIWEERNTHPECNVSYGNIYSMFHESHIQTIKLTKRLNFKTNRWSVRAPTRRANHHESFIHRLGVEAFQDHPPLSWFSSHNCRKSQTSHSITYIRKCFGSVQMKVFYLPLMVPCLSQ